MNIITRFSAKLGQTIVQLMRPGVLIIGASSYESGDTELLLCFLIWIGFLELLVKMDNVAKESGCMI